MKQIILLSLITLSIAACAPQPAHKPVMSGESLWGYWIRNANDRFPAEQRAANMPAIVYYNH